MITSTCIYINICLSTHFLMDNNILNVFFPLLLIQSAVKELGYGVIAPPYLMGLTTKILQKKNIYMYKYN